MSYDYMRERKLHAYDSLVHAVDKKPDGRYARHVCFFFGNGGWQGPVRDRTLRITKKLNLKTN